MSSSSAKPKSPKSKSEKPKVSSPLPSVKKAEEEVKFYGVNVCLAVFKQRRDDIIRAYISQEMLAKAKELLRWCAVTKRAYHVVSSADLEKISQSVHHEGICLYLRSRPCLDDQGLLQTLAARSGQAKQAPLLFLDHTANPHNVGAILRSAAHFGIEFVLGWDASLPRLAGALARNSEGGCEFVTMASLRKPLVTLEKLKAAGYELLTTSSHGGEAYYELSWPSRSVLILGHEVKGLSPGLARLADRQITIPGSGHVESLNVSVSCGVLCAHWFGQQAMAAKRLGKKGLGAPQSRRGEPQARRKK